MTTRENFTIAFKANEIGHLFDAVSLLIETNEKTKNTQFNEELKDLYDKILQKARKQTIQILPEILKIRLSPEDLDIIIYALATYIDDSIRSGYDEEVEYTSKLIEYLRNTNNYCLN